MISNQSTEDFDKKRSSSNLVPERANWSKPIEFVLTCMNYAVGLGNVWRFPHLVYRNKAGSAFLIPYFLMVFIIGLPIFFAELVIGQFSGQGPIKAYTFIAPVFKGIGYCTLIVITLVTVYYQVIISWIIFYLWSSLSSVLEWGTCGNSWNTPNCYSTLEDVACKVNNSNLATDKIFYDHKCTDVETICTNVNISGLNSTHCFDSAKQTAVILSEIINRTVSTEEFFNDNVLGLGDATWSNFGWPQWHLVLCLSLAWIFSFFCVIKGVQSMGKLVYFTAVFPYIVLIILLIRALTLEGSYDGIMHYITPKSESLLDPKMWGDASSQIFYSFGIGCGSLVTLASYNKFKNNCHFDAVFVSIINFFTAVLSGFVVFAILGFLAKSMNVEIDDVMNSGTGLAFVTYPEAVLHIPMSQLWAILFFSMMFVLGIGSQFGGIEAINTAIIDQWPHLRKHQWRVTAGTCISCFIAGIPMTCNGGIYLFTLLDWHTASWAILLIGFAEIVVLSWVYGIERILENIKEMDMKFSPIVKLYWKAIWFVVTPLSCLGVFAYTLMDMTPLAYQTYIFPSWANFMGWVVGFMTLVPLIISIATPFLNCRGKMRFVDYFKPTSEWVPQIDKPEPELSKSLLNLYGNVSLVQKESKTEFSVEFA